LVSAVPTNDVRMLRGNPGRLRSLVNAVLGAFGWLKLTPSIHERPDAHRADSVGCTWVTQQAPNLVFCVDDGSQPVRLFLYDSGYQVHAGSAIFRSEGNTSASPRSSAERKCVRPSDG